MALAGYKTISIVLLMLLVVLAGASPVFAKLDGIVLDPEAGCPGTMVVVFYLDGVPGGGSVLLKLSSDPGGLIDGYQCASVASYQGGSSGLGIAGYNDQGVEVPICNFRVSESAICGTTYDVTLGFDEAEIHSATFTVPDSCCAAVGGCVQPVNTFALLSPWLAVVGLVACIGSVVVVARKRQS